MSDRSSHSLNDSVRHTLRDVLQLGDRGEQLMPQTPLLGELPELDSMALVSVLTALEDRFDIVIEDEEVSAEIFETFGDLVGFVQRKLEERQRNGFA